MVEYGNFVGQIVRPLNGLIRRGDLEKVGNFDPGWVNNPEQKNSLFLLINDLDFIISFANKKLQQGSLDPKWFNLRRAKNEHKIEAIPTITQVLEDCRTNKAPRLEQFKESMITMMDRMKKDSLQFQNRDISDTALMFGALMHAYGEFLALEPGFKNVMSGDEIVDLITEAHLIFETRVNPNPSGLFHLIVDHEELDWVKDWDEFDPRFRKEILGQEDLPEYRKGRIVRTSDNFIVIMEDKPNQIENPGRLYIVPTSEKGEKMLKRAAKKHFFAENTEQRTRGVDEPASTWLRMDYSQEVWDESIAGDDFFVPTEEKHSIPPIQRMEDLIAAGKKLYVFPTGI